LFDETRRLLSETEQRAAELAVINSVQQGLGAQLDMQAIYSLVGDKIRDIFDAQAILILTLDHTRRLRRNVYTREHGQRVVVEGETPFNPLTERLIRTRQSLLINRLDEALIAELGLQLTPGTQHFLRSAVFVPLIAGGVVTGIISLQNVERENAI